jgi:hypothetical protein
MVGSGGGGSGGSMAGSGGSMAGSGGSGGSGGSEGYTDCSECTDLGKGALAKECKSARDACLADAKCAEIYQCSYFNCSSNQQGGCCTLECFQSTNASQASMDLFKAMDGCVYCQTCKSLCGTNAAEYCAVFQPGGSAVCMP